MLLRFAARSPRPASTLSALALGLRLCLRAERPSAAHSARAPRAARTLPSGVHRREADDELTPAGPRGHILRRRDGDFGSATASDALWYAYHRRKRSRGAFVAFVPPTSQRRRFCAAPSASPAFARREGPVKAHSETSPSRGPCRTTRRCPKRAPRCARLRSQTVFCSGRRRGKVESPRRLATRAVRRRTRGRCMLVGFWASPSWSRRARTARSWASSSRSSGGCSRWTCAWPTRSGAARANLLGFGHLRDR